MAVFLTIDRSASLYSQLSRNEYLEQFHGISRLDANHTTAHPAPFLIQEMRTRGSHPCTTDRPIPHPLSTTLQPWQQSWGGVEIWRRKVILGSVGWEWWHGKPGDWWKASSVANSIHRNKPAISCSRNPFRVRTARIHAPPMTQLSNWKSANCRRIDLGRDAEENARNMLDLVGVGT